MAFLCLAATAVFWRFVGGGQAPYWEDLLLYFYPIADLAADSSSGPFTLWNPYIFSGAPLAANPQTFTFYPLRALFYLLPLSRAMTVLLVVHVAGAGVAMYAFLRAGRLARAAALVGATAFMLSSYVVTHFFEVTMTLAVAWVPLVLWAADRVGREGDLGAAVWGGLASGMQVLAGHLQTWYLTLLLAGVYAVGLMIVEKRRREVRRWGRGTLLLALLAAVGVGFAAVQLLPLLDFVSRLARPPDPYGFAVQYSMAPRALIRLLAPDFFGAPQTNDYWGEWNYWELGGYLGLLPLLLCAVAVASSRRPERYVLLAIIAVSLVLAMGGYTPLYRLAYGAVPGLGLFRAPSRFLLWFTTAGAVLAALGVEALSAPGSKRRAGRALAMAAVGSLAALGALWLMEMGARAAPQSIQVMWLFRPWQWSVHAAAREGPEIIAHILARAGGALGLGVAWTAAGVAAAALALLPRWRRAAPAAVLAVLTADLFLAGVSFNVGTEPAVLAPPAPEILAHFDDRPLSRIYLPTGYRGRLITRYATFGGFGPSEATHLEGFRASLAPNINILDRVPSVVGYDPLIGGAYGEILTALEEQMQREGRSTLLDFLGGRFILSDQPLEAAGYRLLTRRRGIFVYENPRAGDKLTAVPAYTVAPRGAAYALLASGRVDLERTALVSEDPFPPGRIPSGPLGAQLSVTEYSADRIRARATLTRPALVVINDTYDPGWRARVDGRPVKVVEANGAFRGVAVPAGSHELVLTYRPRGLSTGAALSGLVLAGAAILLVRRRRAVRSGMAGPPLNGEALPAAGDTVPRSRDPAVPPNDAAVPPQAPAPPERTFTGAGKSGARGEVER